MPAPRIHVPDDVWDAAIAKLSAGEITRQQCADMVGLKYQTLIQRLRGNKYRHLDFNLGAHPNSGENNVRAREDMDRHQRYKDAVDMAIRVGNVKHAADKFEVNYQVLVRKVREARAGMPARVAKEAQQ